MVNLNSKTEMESEHYRHQLGGVRGFIHQNHVAQTVADQQLLVQKKSL